MTLLQFIRSYHIEKGGEYDIPYDSRPLLGLPGTFRNQQILDDKENKLVEKETKIVEKETTRKKIIY